MNRKNSRTGRLARAFGLALAFLFFSKYIFGIIISRAEDVTEAIEVNAAYGYKNFPVAMEASYGYDNMAKGGRYLPVYVTLTNQQDSSFLGSVAVKSIESNYGIYEYSYPVALDGEETIQLNLNIPLGLRSDQLYVLLCDEEGNERLKKRLKMNIRQDTPELLIGTLSDSQDKLEYLNGVGIHYSTLMTRTCTMVAGSISEQAAGLDQLDVLLITNYDIRRLSSAQIDTIKEWVSRGGILLLGTGSSGQEAVETFLENEIKGELSDPVKRIVDMGEEFAIYGPGDVQLSLMTTQVEITDGTPVLSSFGRPVVTAVNREKGMIAVAAYDFSDISSFCLEHPYVDKLFTNLLGNNRIQDLADYMYNGGYNIYWAVQSIINTGALDKLPKISMYAVVIFIYICLAGPGLYLFLKHQKGRQYYYQSVILLSVFCSGIIYLMGSKTRFMDTFFHYASIQDYAKDTIVESTYINMQTPYNRPFSVVLDSSYDIRPVTRIQEDNHSRFSKFTGDEEANIRIDFKEEGSRFTVQDVGAFTPNYFRLEKRAENEGQKGLTGNVLCFDGEFSGEVTNHLDIDLEQAAVICSGAMVLIDKIHAGETVHLEDFPVLCYSGINSYSAANRITGGYQFDKVNIDSTEYITALNRSNLLGFYLDNFLTGYQHGARVLAFAAGEEHPQFLSEQEKYEVNGFSLYTASLETHYRKENKVYHTSLEQIPTVVSGTYNTEKNTMDGMSPLTLEYFFGKNIDIEKLSFVRVSDEFLQNSKYGSLPVFDGDIYFYNYTTGNYDKMESGQDNFLGWQLEAYLSSENRLTVKYAFDTHKEYMPDIILPVITVTGEEKR